MAASENLGIQAKPSVIEEPEFTNFNEVRDWPPRKKAVNFALVCSISFIGHFSSSIYYWAFDNFIDKRVFWTKVVTRSTSTPKSIHVFLPKRPIYVGAMFLYTVFSALTGISTHFSAFMTFRILQGLFSGVGLALGGGSCSDLYDSHARGRAMAIYVLCVITGSAISPIIGGYTATRLNWQWIFYILTMMGGVLFLLTLFFLQETIKRLPLEKNSSNLCANFWLPWRVVRRPETLCICLVQCAIFGWIYLIVVMLPTTLQSAYALSTDIVSLVYLAGGVGDGLGALTAGFLSDRLHRLRMLRNRDMARVEYRLVPAFYLSLPFALSGALLYGWSTQARMIYYVPMCGYFLYSFGSSSFITLSNSYIIEANRRYASTAVSVSQFLRIVCSMLFTAVSVRMYDQLSVGWHRFGRYYPGYVFLSGIGILPGVQVEK
ncbi:hypothetical protein [Absidia glauca]|uniref:Major facilitator superfamily (MFS) profile domain-containing protein n=1 Tax=Absidia glauca TaxID=4829 RepID=A0A168TD89_ABSGL|nr:hypothetical protein [Absidia glauca]